MASFQPYRGVSCFYDILLFFLLFFSFCSVLLSRQQLIQLQLSSVELIVSTFERKELFVGTTLDNPTMLQNHDGVAVSDGG